MKRIKKMKWTRRLRLRIRSASREERSRLEEGKTIDSSEQRVVKNGRLKQLKQDTGQVGIHKE